MGFQGSGLWIYRGQDLGCSVMSHIRRVSVAISTVKYSYGI